MLTFETLPKHLPWQRHAYLVLDGVSVKNLLAQAYEWFGTPDLQLLYANTPLAPCNELSPCLITLNGPNTPGLSHYFAHAVEEWGYLIFSEASSFDVITHLRLLLNAHYQPQGQKVWLRVADPAVMQAVMSHAAGTQKPEVFGPIDQVVLPDVIHNTWQHHIRPGDIPRPLPAQPYALCEAQQAMLDEVRFRSTLKVLEKHVREKFPGYGAQWSSDVRWRWVRERADKAYACGFTSNQDICLYTNVFLLLGDYALEQHSDIAALINETSTLTPSQRIEKAAELAYLRSVVFEGSRV
ncbi:DUF4123 domain-containing protein [Pseudomonas sp. 7P_10.2_Bac1]|uniref:DUF4123 domain-containing protein n=1 Tax=Pseudomonas sp. 7P_10.2_Bac1 TaxID=2971614 RepID=UPI0021CA80CE|nr:DUF4123 domain-containing protein [Pseudomonas sp. 7P_10.2_Bac1]MCU1728452.1 DUF4123 domain-containing protein [Pseudomonas sp. 7P_10.2_Bac1]